MPSILSCRTVHGNLTCLERDPDIAIVRDCVFVPAQDPENSAGLYDYSRRAVPATIFARGPDIRDGLGHAACSFDTNGVRVIGEDDEYIWLGFIDGHYGHFVLSTLSRLWPLDLIAGSNAKLLYIDGPDTAGHLANPEVQACLAAAGIAPDRLVTFRERTKLTQVIVPTASFEELNFAHRVYATSCNRIGRRIIGDAALRIDPTPVYLSKARLDRGVRKLVNEDVIERELERLGFDIVHPEEMAFPDQVRLWYERPNVAAFSGSAVHTSVFAPGRNLFVFAYENTVDSSFLLCDWANRTASQYFQFAEDDIVHVRNPSRPPGGAGFSTESTARHPEKIAALIDKAVRFTAGSSPSAKVSSRKAILDLARDRPVEASSRLASEEIAGLGVTSGRLTGRAQVHTEYEPEPWVTIDLGADARLTEIVLYNRTDVAAERLSSFAIELSSDGVRFDKAHVRRNGAVFGGLNGEPFRYRPFLAVRARYVRIVLLGTDFLHLDQVEIRGTFL